MAQVLTETAALAPGNPAGSADAAALPALRCVFLVGDVLLRSIVARLRRLAPRLTVVNHYGSTETQRAVGYHVLAPPSAAAAGERPQGERSREVLPLGRGIPDVQLLVLAPGGLRAAAAAATAAEGGLPAGLAGIGEVGEIALRSPHIARGYRGDAALTGERFLASPWAHPAAGAAAGDRLYRTGDLGRYLPDGQVTFAGRADHQVKIRGFRIELAEIEGRLCRTPGVREAVVAAREEAAGDRRLVAYVVAEPGAALAAADLRARLKEQLPSYMVPAALLLVAAIPLTPNGKIDRRALSRLDAGPQEDDVTYRAPETDVEKEIAGILKEVLQIEHVGVDDNFFELGGNSLLLVQVHARLQQTFATEIPAVDIFNHPTVAALARYLVELRSGGGAAAGPAVSDDRAEKLKEGRNRLRRRFVQQRSTGTDGRPE
jgi:acyl-CoA synthetase (AMP-forming)/AMP-acid ligase II/acyl carrier protein